jgi:hypothetical protein
LQRSLRPHDGQTWRRRFSSSAFFARPAFIISHAAPDASAMTSSACGSIGNVVFLSPAPASVGVRPVIQLSTAAVGYVGVQLGRREIGMAEHFLNRSEVGASLEEVSRERVAEQVRVDSLWIEARALGEPAQDQECPRPGQPAAAGVQEQLGTAAGVEVGAPA